MQWLERIHQTCDGTLAPIYVDDWGRRNVGRLQDASKFFPRQGSFTIFVPNFPLAKLQQSNTRDYLHGLGSDLHRTDFRRIDPLGHRTYVLEHEGLRILIPALVLIMSLFGRLGRFADHLLEPASLDRIAMPAIVPDSAQVKASLSPRLYLNSHVRFEWLTCFASARRAWGSVYLHGSSGSLDLDLPDATLDATFFGDKFNGVICATRMTIRCLAPSEPPLPFAVGRTPPFFYIDRRHLKEEGVRRISRLSNIPCGPHGWSTTDNEWAAIKSALQRGGFLRVNTAKSSIDQALEKLGKGVPWFALGVKHQGVSAAYRTWIRSGRWRILTRVLRKLRQ